MTHAVYYSTRGVLVGMGAAINLLATTLAPLLAPLLSCRQPPVLCAEPGTPHYCDIGVLFGATIAGGTGTRWQAAPGCRPLMRSMKGWPGSMFWRDMQPGVLDRDRRD